MKKLTKQLIQKMLAKRGLALVSLAEWSCLAGAEALLPNGGGGEQDYVPATKNGTSGFSLNWQHQLSFLEMLGEPLFQEFFRMLREDLRVNVGYMGRNYMQDGLIHNGYYPTPDAEIYGAMIAHYKPHQIIEVGSGYSTAIAHKALRHFNIPCEIHVIDPEPRQDITNYASKIENKLVQDSSLFSSPHSIKKGTILFIDSSHVTKVGGDIPFLYCRILPNLTAGVLVHIHDIFIPYDYPANYGRRFYTEQYVLHALLANSAKYSVVFSTHAMSRTYSAEMRAVFGPRVSSDPLFFGASFWMNTVS